MTLGLAERQGGLFNVAVARCEAELPERSIYRLLHAERDRLFPDELFSDLYIHHGRQPGRLGHPAPGRPSLGVGLWRLDPAARAYAASLRARGKPPGVIATAMANRANRIAFAMVRDQRPYDPNRWR